MAFLSASKAVSFFETFLPLLLSKLPWFFLGIYVHHIGVLGESTPGRSGGMEGDRGSGGVLFCDSSHKALLAEKLVNLLVPSFGHGWDYFHAVDSV